MQRRFTLGSVILLSLALVVGGCSSPSQRTTFVPQSYRVTQGAPHGGGISIVGTGKNSALDKLVTTFMTDSQVPNAEVAVSSKGKTLFSHAYTNTSLAKEKTSTSTIMRLASVSKAWVDAAIYQLITAGKVNPNAKVFSYLGITKPLPANAKVDQRVYQITIQNMIDHKSGWDDSVGAKYDPTFHMREIALGLGLTKEVNQTQYVQAQLAQPLQEAPGTTYAYCNFCYTTLGMVIAKASHMTFAKYIAEKVAAPMGLHNVLQSHTIGKPVKNEIKDYYSAYTGLSAIYVTSSKQWPYPYSGDDMSLEVAGGASALATNAQSMLTFMNHYIIWGTGKPQAGADWAREGSMPGTNSWSEQLPNGTNYAVIVNTRQYDYGSDPNAFENLQPQIEKLLDP